MSLLLSEGHPYAQHYPVGMVWDEARLVVERRNGEHATTAMLTQLAVVSVLSKDGAGHFKKTITRLNDSGYEQE